MTISTKTVVSFNPATEAAEAKKFKEEHPGWKEDVTTVALSYIYSDWYIVYPKKGDANEQSEDGI